MATISEKIDEIILSLGGEIPGDNMITSKLDSIIAAKGGSATEDNLITSKLRYIAELLNGSSAASLYTDILADIINAMGGECGSKMISDQLNVIADLVENPDVPVVPQTGTWQLKTTTNKKYVIIGTDDDNGGNAAFFRLLRTFNFPYTMNVEAENLTKSLGNDLNENFTDDDAPSLFPDGVTVTQLGQYLKSSGKGEVAQHGASSKTLWDSANLVGSNWSTLYNYYTSNGGTKTESELKSAISTELSDTDGSNDAPYVATSRASIESAMGFSIDTVGIWGGSPSCNIDGIELDLNTFKGTSNYDWRCHNYWSVSSRLGSVAPNTSPYNISRITDSPANDLLELGNINAGNAVEFFWHKPFNDHAFSEYRTMFSQLSEDENIEVVTRYQYSKLGAYVSNPIVSITITPSKSTFSTEETISSENFTCVANYFDGTSGNCEEDMILDLSGISVGVQGVYTAKVLYRGFSSSCSISIVGSGFALPQFIQNATSGDYQMLQGVNDNDFVCLVYIDSDAGGFNKSAYAYNHAYVWKPNARPSNCKIFITYDGSSNWNEVYSNSMPAALKTTDTNYFGDYAFTSDSVPCTLGEVVHIG